MVLLRRRLFAVICFVIGICAVSILCDEVCLLSAGIVTGGFKAGGSATGSLLVNSFFFAIEGADSFVSMFVAAFALGFSVLFFAFN